MKKEKMNDKGFSLVELIIVIAIMAVLVVVLAPQYLKYVERSRNSTDLQNATEIVTALQVYGSDPEATEPIPSTGSVSIKVDSSGSATISGAFAVAALKDAGLADSTGKLSMRCQSKTTWTSYTITGTADGNGGLNFSYSNEGTNTTAFADAMAGKSKTTTGDNSGN